MNLRLCQWLTPLLMLVSGCDLGKPAGTSTEKDASRQTVENDVPIELSVATFADLDELIAQQSGKVVVLDLWAMW